MKVLLTALLLFVLFTNNAFAQDTASNGISKISGIDMMVVEESLDSLAYDADLKQLSLTSENTKLAIENWSEEWLVALLDLTTSTDLTATDSEAIQPLSLSTGTDITLRSQGQFRMSGPFEMITLYEKANEDSTLDEDSFLLFIGNDIPLKLTWLPEFEAKIETSEVLEGELELTYNNQPYLVVPNTVTPLTDGFCTYLMALNESQASDIMGNKTSEWRFDVALFKCDGLELTTE